MKFMVELRLKPGSRNSAFQIFEERGPNRTPGVTLRGAWVASRQDLVYALVEAASEALVQQTASSWEEQEDYKVTPVLDIEQY